MINGWKLVTSKAGLARPFLVSLKVVLQCCIRAACWLSNLWRTLYLVNYEEEPMISGWWEASMKIWKIGLSSLSCCSCYCKTSNLLFFCQRETLIANTVICFEWQLQIQEEHCFFFVSLHSIANNYLWYSIEGIRHSYISSQFLLQLFSFDCICIGSKD